MSVYLAINDYYIENRWTDLWKPYLEGEFCLLENGSVAKSIPFAKSFFSAKSLVKEFLLQNQVRQVDGEDSGHDQVRLLVRNLTTQRFTFQLFFVVSSLQYIL